MPGVRAEKRIFPRRLRSHKAKGLNRIFLKKFSFVEDTFIVWDKALFRGFWIGRHTIGGFTDFLDGGTLVEDEQVVLRDVRV